MRAALISALSLPVVALAQDQEEAQPELSENTSEGLEKLRPMLDAKDWTGAITLVNTLLAKASPDSYDTAFLSDTLGKLYLQKGEYDKAVPPMEAALRLSERHPKFFRASTVQDMRYYLAQIYYQNSAAVKNPAQQLQGFSKANAFLELWLANSKRPNSESLQQDAVLFHAMLLYNMAVINPEKIDTSILTKAEAEVDRGLHMSAHPKENLYTLLLAICQQKNDYVRASEILELLVHQYPNKKEYWSQLVSVYLNLAQDKNEDKSREYNIRGIITIERAQALGFMKSPKENYNLVGVYFNVGQFGHATELLYNGLKSGAIDSEQKNWELLAYSYQQIDKPAQAIEVLKEASKLFPASGQLDYQIAQIYYGISKSEDAYRALNSAVTKDHLDKPGTVFGFLAYVSFELTKYEEALAAAEKALTYPDSKNDAQLPKLRQAVIDAIKDRELQKAHTEALQKA